MAEYQICATCTFGLEAVLKKEIKDLGYEIAESEEGAVIINGTERDVARLNIRLRCADRVSIKLAEFRADNFDKYFDSIYRIPWGDIIDKNGKIVVNSRSIKSKLQSIPTNQGMAKKAIVKNLQRKYKLRTLPERGSEYKIDVNIRNNIVKVFLDTTGEGLFKRGYRRTAGRAPIKETLAAGIVMLSRFRQDDYLVDPFCGSGTFLIEATMIAKNIAPGMHRSFSGAELGFLKGMFWGEERKIAEGEIVYNEFRAFGYDNDSLVLKKARRNSENAGVDEYIDFHVREFKDFSTKIPKGMIITNPPYGERLDSKENVREIYEAFGELHTIIPNWRLNIFTAFPDFENTFGKKSRKNRKLFNGNLKSYLYQYF